MKDTTIQVINIHLLGKATKQKVYRADKLQLSQTKPWPEKLGTDLATSKNPLRHYLTTKTLMAGCITEGDLREFISVLQLSAPFNC
jgi:hypothetical protein